jgi:hypothetical protein
VTVLAQREPSGSDFGPGVGSQWTVGPWDRGTVGP